MEAGLRLVGLGLVGEYRGGGGGGAERGGGAAAVYGGGAAVGDGECPQARYRCYWKVGEGGDLPRGGGRSWEKPCQ